MPEPSYRLPPEWAPQWAVQLTWPHADSDWAERLSQVEPVFAAIAREIGRREHVLIACHDETAAASCRRALSAAGAELDCCHIHIVPSNDTWARDHGPITVLDRENRPLLLDFAFNAWGLKYAADRDNRITRRLHAQGAYGATPLKTLGLVLEGGSIEVDGTGTLLTTEACLLSPNRNPHLDKAGIEAVLRATLGIERVLWLPHGHLEGDDTDAHIDTLARFSDSDTIVYQACNDPADSHFAPLGRMAEELATFRNAGNRPYRLVPLPWPRARHDDAGDRLPLTYANFLIINGAVLLPTYDDPADEEAQALLQEAFPNREVVPIPCLELTRQHGSLHCTAMQLPS